MSPVIYIALTGNTQIRGLNEAICRFYGLPVSGNADTLAARAVDAVQSLAAQAIVVDDIHFLDMARRDAQVMANHFKYLSNAFPVTLLYIGVGVATAASWTKDSHPPRPCSPSSGAAPRP